MEVRGLLAQAYHFLRQSRAAGTALGPHLAESHIHPKLSAFFFHQFQLCRRVCWEGIDGHHAGQAEHVFDVVHVLEQVGQALFQGLQVLLVQLRLGGAAVVLQSPDRGHDHHRVWLQPRHAALDVQEFLRPQVRAETRLGDGIVPQLQGHPGGGDGVAAVSDVGKGTAVDQGRGMLQGLDQVGLQGVLQQGRHSPLRLQVMGGHRVAGIGVAHHDPAQPGLQVRDVRRQAQHRHDLAGHGDVEAVLPGHALHPAPQAVHDVPELPVVHIHAPPPGDLLGVDAQGVALLDVVVQHRRQQVVGRADGVEVPGEVEVDVLHGDHLGIAAAGGTALDAEHRSQGRLPQCHHGVFADPPQAVRQAHRGGGLALSRRGGGDGGHQHQFAVRPVRLLQKPVVDLGLVPAIGLKIRLLHPAGLRHGGDGQRLCLLRDLDVAFHGHLCLLSPLRAACPARLFSLSIIPAAAAKRNCPGQNPPVFESLRGNPGRSPVRPRRPVPPAISWNDSRLMEIPSGQFTGKGAIILHREGWIFLFETVYSDESRCMIREKRT